MSQTRFDMPWGFIELGNNEVHVVSTVEDPPAVYCASKAGISLGSMAFGRLRSDGRIETMVLLQGKQDERTRQDPHNYSGEVTLHIRHWQPGVGDDAQMVRVCEARHDGVRFDVPVTAPNLLPNQLI